MTGLRTRALPATALIGDALVKALFLVAISSGVPASAAPETASLDPTWTFPLTMTTAELAAVCGPGRDWLDLWIRADLGFAAATDAITGRLDSGCDVWIRTPESLADNARVSKSVGSGIRCTSVDVEVYSPADGTSRRIAEKDMDWQGQLDGGNGVITLDSANYSAVIPGLRVGDRLRITWHKEWVRSHGMPVVNLHGEGGGAAHVFVQVQVPAGQHLTYGLVGTPGLVGDVSFRAANRDGCESASWEYRDAPRGTGDTRDDDGVLRLVTHVAVDDAMLMPTTFAAASDWQRAARGYRTRVESSLAPSGELSSLAKSLVAGRVSRQDSIAALYEHVQSSTRYLGLFAGDGGIIPAAAEQTQRLGYGDCKGLATLLIALCRAVDIPAWPVIVLADDEAYLASDIPNMAQFNHFIAWAEDGQGGCWLDPTLDGVPAGVVNYLDADKPVITTRPGFEGLCRIPRSAWDPGRRIVHVEGTVDDGLRLQASVSLSATGPGGRALSARIDRLDGKRRDTVVRDLLLAPGLRQSPAHADAADAADTLPTWRLAFGAAAPLPAGAGKLLLPAEIAFLPELHDRAEDAMDAAGPPARADRREVWCLAMPAGWALASPDSFTVAGPGLRWMRAVRQDGDTIRLRRELDWSDSDVPQEDQAAVAATLNGAISRERAPLILKRR